ncbi:MAG: crossover junction endodeoxyribonuclease RuvC [Actinomycetota bacterium]
MFDSRVIGVDPGMANVGLAVVERRDRRSRIVWASTVRTAAGTPEPDRIRRVASALRDALAAYEPRTLALERVAWNVNEASAMAVSRATGALLMVAAEAGVTVAEYGPLEVKNAVAGSGRASKPQVREALRRIHALQDVPSEPDACDAVAVAITHLVRSRFTEAVAHAARR